MGAETCSAGQGGSTGWAIFGYVIFLYIVAKIVLSLWRAIYTCFLGPLLGFNADLKKMGKWAVVTGATDGIGKAYAEQLAAKGLNIVLISRTPEKLQAVSDEIEKKYNVEVRSLAVDFTQDDIYPHIERELNQLEVGVLVNNVGMSYDYAEYFTKIPNCTKKIEQMVNANIIACTKVTQIVLGQMEKRRKGAIINISSISALYPAPLLSLYGATKAYVDHFTRGLYYEYKSKGIIVQCVLPAFVSTKMSKIRKPSLNVPTPETYVRWALTTVGLEHRTAGYPPHKLQQYLQEFLGIYFPESVGCGIIMKNLMDLRRKYYKRFGLTDDDDLSSVAGKKTS